MKKSMCSIKNKIIGVGRPCVCVPLVGRTHDEVIEKLDRILEAAAKTRVDMIEFRADYYENVQDLDALTELLKEIYQRLEDIILLFTLRSAKEGGEALKYSYPLANDINEHVIDNRLADMVDIEFFSPKKERDYLLDLAYERNMKIIFSNHDFEGTPDSQEVISRLCRMQAYGADIVKIAVTPRNKWELFTFMSAISGMNEDFARVPVVGIAMGRLGSLSRVTGELIGSAISFGTIDEGSAPGQIPVEELNSLIDMIGKHCV